MASKRGVRRREIKKKCEGKRKYETEGQAIGACVQIQRREKGLRGDMSPYKCSFCHMFHIGHTPSHVIKARVRKMIK